MNSLVFPDYTWSTKPDDVPGKPSPSFYQTKQLNIFLKLFLQITQDLGASALQLWSLISQEFIWLMIIASAVAIPISVWVLNGWLDGYEYRISLQWWVFLIGCLGALVLTILTTSFKSLTAINLNPAETLKDE